jgi:hypothetical protein
VAGASLLIPEELVEHAPDVAGSGVAGHHGLRQVGGDGAGDSRLDDAIHATQSGKPGVGVSWMMKYFPTTWS